MGYTGYSGIPAAKIDGILGYMGCFEVLGAKINGILEYMGYMERFGDTWEFGDLNLRFASTRFSKSFPASIQGNSEIQRIPRKGLIRLIRLVVGDSAFDELTRGTQAAPPMRSRGRKSLNTK